jgi:hypothetical protein
MLGLFDFRSDKTRKRHEREKKARNKKRAKKAVPWEPGMKYSEEMALKADTYPVRHLFKVKPLESMDVRTAKKNQRVVSPSGKWAYCEKVLPPATALSTAYGSRRGDVVFDKPTLIPALHSMQFDRDGEEREWDPSPWMSTTPMELLTLRLGTRFAKGHTIVAGLGLGHQLIECAKRKQVKKLTLVEISQELVDWVMPALKPHLEMDVEVVVGNAYEVIPDMTADAALIDIFHSHGGNDFKSCPNINKVWCWGAQYSRTGRRLW